MKDPEQKIDCEWVQDRIESSIDGDLSRADLARLESHLGSCQACREEWAFAKEIKENLAGLPQPLCPEGVVKAAWEEIRKEEHSAQQGWKSFWRRAREPWTWRPAIAAGWALVLAIGLWSVFRQPSAPHPEKVVSKPPEMVNPADLARATRQVEVTLAYMEQVGRQSLLAAGSRVLKLAVLEPVKKAQSRSLKDGATPTERPIEN